MCIYYGYFVQFLFHLYFSQNTQMWRDEAGINPAAAISLGPGSVWLKTAVSVRVSEESRNWKKQHTETGLWGWGKGASPQVPSHDVREAINALWCSFPALGLSSRFFSTLVLWWNSQTELMSIFSQVHNPSPLLLHKYLHPGYPCPHSSHVLPWPLTSVSDTSLPLLYKTSSCR